MTGPLATATEIVDYADCAAGVLSTAAGQLNPYKLGVELLRYVEERWDKGKFGVEWDRCDDYEARRSWDKRVGKGREKLFEVRKLYNDVTFIDEFFTEDFCRAQKFYTFGWNERETQWEIQSREFRKVKDKLLFSLTNFGQPFIMVEDANYGNRGEILLRHRHEGVDLKADYARDTLTNLERVWRRPVNLRTEFDGKPRILRCEKGQQSDAAPE
jgi:stage V sporulation protein R